MKTEKYRPNVAAFIVDESGNYLFCHRADQECKKTGFQVPQGGVEAGESFEEAIARELKEEVNLSTYKILGRLKNPIRYKWGSGEENRGSPYVGQEQIYYLVEVDEKGRAEITPSDDFDFYRWVNISVILSEVYDLKKPVYQQAYSELKHFIKS